MLYIALFHQSCHSLKQKWYSIYQKFIGFNKVGLEATGNSSEAEMGHKAIDLWRRHQMQCLQASAGDVHFKQSAKDNTGNL